MKVRKIKVYKYGNFLFEYHSDLIPRVEDIISVVDNPCTVNAVEYKIKYSVVSEVLVGVI